MSTIQVADETFVAAPAERVAHAVADRSRWQLWWPDLQLEVSQDRGPQGTRWRVQGPVTGTMEVWLEARLDGVVLHYFLHAEPTSRPGDHVRSDRSRTRVRRAAALSHRHRVAGRLMSSDVKRRLESGRAIGDPAVGHAEKAEATR